MSALPESTVAQKTPRNSNIVRIGILCPDKLVEDGLLRTLHETSLDEIIVQPFDFSNLDLLICWGHPHKLPVEVLSLPRFGCINMHPSLLPRHRGRIPLAWALREGDEAWGITWHRMDAGFDTGPILAQDTIPIEDTDVDVFEIEAKVRMKALEMLPWVLNHVIDLDPGRPQLGTPSYAPRFVEDEYARIDRSNTARYVHNQVRAWNMNRYPFLAPVLPVNIIPRRTSLTETNGIRIECADAPIWVDLFKINWDLK